MPDFSASGIYGLPGMTLEALNKGGDPRVVGWVREAVAEGDRINRDDPAYDRFDLALRYVSGEQRRDPAEDKITYLPKVQINESRKALQAHVSALTDLKPTFGFKTANQAYEPHAALLNQLIVAWWINTMADIELGHCIKYALTGGTGDLVVDYDPYAPSGGENYITARDPRDTLPIRPGQYRNPQQWQGVVFREEHTVNALRNQFPDKAHLFLPTSDSLLSSLMGRFRTTMARLISPSVDTLSGLAPTTHSGKTRSGGCLLYRTYLTDMTRNLTDHPIVMGDPLANWAYTVPPQGLLYPQKRLIVSTDAAVVYDGPSTYWHGLYPFSRLKTWELPWHFLGLGLLHDLIPLQDAINDTANDLRLHFKKSVAPGVIYNRRAVSENMMRQYDSRRPNAKVRIEQPIATEPFKELVPPQLPPWGLEFFQGLRSIYHDLTGTANLESLLQLRQMPGADTIQRYYEALTPELRQEGRMVEAFLRPVAEMIKVNLFQYMSVAKRISLLGDAGVTLNDFDFDPDSLVPALQVGQPGYTPELDASVSRASRAKFFHKQFVFMVAPNSILAMNAQEEKLLRLQLARMGYYDFWSLMENLEIPNIGTPPPMPLPPLQPPDPQTAMAVVMAAINPLAAQTDPALQAVAGKYTLDPASGQILEIRVPQTVTERLMAQSLLGIGMTQNPAGRKATAQAAPAVETKPDETGAPRTTVTESPK